jgi:hypothetical protein
VSVPRDTAIVIATNDDADANIDSAVSSATLLTPEIPKPGNDIPDS